MSPRVPLAASLLLLPLGSAAWADSLPDPPDAAPPAAATPAASIPDADLGSAAGAGPDPSPRANHPAAARADTCPTGDRDASSVSVTGSVLERTTGVPLEGAAVSLYVIRGPEGAGSVLEQVAGEGGRFAFCGLGAPGSVRLLAEFRERFSNSKYFLFQGGEELRHDLRIPLGERAHVVGWVVDRESGRPVENAHVTLEPVNLQVFADGEGRFRLTKVPPGAYRMVVRHLAYATQADSIRVPEGSGVEVVAELAPEAIPMAPLEVSVKAGPRYLMDEGFYERRRTAIGGRFFGPEDLERRRPARLSHLIEPVPRVRIRRVCEGRICGPVPTLRRGVRDCRMSMWVDGFPFPLYPPLGVNEIPASDVAAVEVYTSAAEVPLEFERAGDGGCGALVIWTKRG